MSATHLRNRGPAGGDHFYATGHLSHARLPPRSAVTRDDGGRPARRRARREATVSLVVETEDFDATLAVFTAARGTVRIRGRDGQAGMRLAHGSIGPVAIDRLTLGMDIDIDVGPA